MTRGLGESCLVLGLEIGLGSVVQVVEGWRLRPDPSMAPMLFPSPGRDPEREGHQWQEAFLRSLH